MGNNGYANPYALGDMPMDLGSFTEAFNWVCCFLGISCYQRLIMYRAVCQSIPKRSRTDSFHNVRSLSEVTCSGFAESVDVEVGRGSTELVFV